MTDRGVGYISHAFHDAFITLGQHHIRTRRFTPKIYRYSAANRGNRRLRNNYMLFIQIGYLGKMDIMRLFLLTNKLIKTRVRTY